MIPRSKLKKKKKIDIDDIFNVSTMFQMNCANLSHSIVRTETEQDILTLHYKLSTSQFSPLKYECTNKFHQKNDS